MSNRLNIPAIESRAYKQIVKNYNQDELYYDAKHEINQGFETRKKPCMNDEELEMLDNIISDIVKYHPNFKVRQRVRNCKLLMDGKGKGTEYVLFSPATYEQWSHSNKSLEKILTKWDIESRVHHTNMEWNPYKKIKLEKGKNGWWVFNTYVPPIWVGMDFYKKEFIYPKSKLPEIYEIFLNHLVDNDKESFEYILDWLATVIQPNKRNFCILTTIGQQGIGKGVLGEIMQKLVGNENCSLTTQKAISGTFNKQLLNKIIVYINEVEVKRYGDENRLKSYIDETIEIEAKHVDAVSITNHGNLYISTNNEDALRLTADDRRFSIVMLTKKKLLPSYWKELSGHTIPDLFKIENIKKLGNYLMNREVDSKKMAVPLQTKLTDEVREASLKVWEFYLVETLWYDFKGKEYPLEKISRILEEKFGSKVQVGPT